MLMPAPTGVASGLQISFPVRPAPCVRLRCPGQRRSENVASPLPSVYNVPLLLLAFRTAGNCERALKLPVGAIEDLSGALNIETFVVPLPHVLKIKTILNS